MESRATADALKAIEASVAALGVVARGASGSSGSTGPDLLRNQVDARLDGLAEVALVKAEVAGRKTRLVAGYPHRSSTAPLLSDPRGMI